MAEVGITFGAFDLCHAGHVDFLTKCQTFCEAAYCSLWICVHTDPSIERPHKNRPLQTTYERYTQLNRFVLPSNGFIIPYDTERDLRNILAMNKPQYYFVGSDYFDAKTEQSKIAQDVQDICQRFDITIHYIERDHDYSSSELRNRLNAKDNSIGNKTRRR